MHVLYGGMGGQLTVASMLADCFRTRGLSSAVCLYAPPGEHVPALELADTFDQVVSVSKRRRLDLAGSSRIGRAVRALQPRTVLWHSPYAPLAMIRSRLKGTPRSLLLVEHQAIDLRSTGNDARSLVGGLAASSVVLLSQDYANRYRFRRLPVPALRRSTVIPTGIDLARYRPASVRDQRELRVGMLGRMTPTKDVATVVRAWADLMQGLDDPARLVLAGDGPTRPDLEGLVAELGLRDTVDFLGRIPEADVAQFLRSLDAYVHASLGETLSTSILQAYATGLPIIASDVAGLRDLVQHDVDGLLIDTSEPGALAACLNDLLRNEAERHRLGSSARRRAERHFGAETMAEAYLHLLDRVDPGGPWLDALEACPGTGGGQPGEAP